MSEKIQWHPAFFATIQLELEEYKDSLSFIAEHQLSEKPLQMDVLIIKKVKDVVIEKNIGKIFRGHNVIEYKSPTDYLSINDYYKVVAYALFYKSLQPMADEIEIDDMTVTFVVKKHPDKLIKHLQAHGLEVKEVYQGIQYVTGERIPIQIIVNTELSEEENLYLRTLTDDLNDINLFSKVFNKTEKYLNDEHFEAFLAVMMTANSSLIEEVTEMKFNTMEDITKYVLHSSGFDEKYMQIGRQEGRQEGLILGETKGFRRRSLEIAKRMLRDKQPFSMIQNYTDLTEEEIKALEKDITL